MDLSIRWLEDYIKPGVPAKEFCAAMTRTGSKVESFREEAAPLAGIFVGKIVEKRPHENADALFVCQVDLGDGKLLQVVTNDAHVQPGDLVPVATSGAIVREGGESLTIRNTKVRGIKSEGMFCGLSSLGVTVHDFPYADEKGVMVIEEKDCVPGEPVSKALGLDDTIVEFEITSNRPDCLSVTGLAREAAAAFGQRLARKEPTFHGTSEDIQQVLSVTVENKEDCPHYVAGLVRNVKIAPSPRWMRERLRASGVRPINNLVDITNFVMLEYGQPMHAFDLRYVEGGEIHVRNAREGERITTLDGEERALRPEMLIIADAKKPIAVAGVMGGEYSGIMEDTVDVVFESAYFAPVQVRRTAKALGMRTDASARYEKGLDPTSMQRSLKRAFSLVELLGAGEPVGSVIDCDYTKREPVKIPFDPVWINGFLGTDIPEAEMIRYLHNLEIEVENGECICPSFRVDLERPADIAEEVARSYGYDKIPSTFLRGLADGQLTREQKFLRSVSQGLAGLGCSGILTYSFISPKWFDKILLPKDSPLRRTVTIRNPLGEETSVMQTTTLPGMLEILANNYHHRAERAWLFEIGKEYLPAEDPDTLPEEPYRLTIGMYGACDFFTLKGILERLLAKLSIGDLHFERPEEECPYEEKCAFHPGRSAVLLSGYTPLGIFGELHPQVLKNYDMDTRAYAAKLDVPNLRAASRENAPYEPLPKYPAVTRDLSLICDESLPAAQLETVIRESAGRFLEKLELFDLYRGEQIAAGKKSLAYKLVLRNREETMTGEQADAAMKRIQKALAKLNVQIRDGAA